MNCAWLWNGHSFEPCTGVPLTDRGFRHGMSLFETVLVRHTVPVLLSAHLARLEHACVAHGFPVTSDALAATADVIEHAGIEHGVARIHVTAGDGALDTRVVAPRLLVCVEARKPLPEAEYERGWKVWVVETPHAPLFPGEKTGLYWANLAARTTAQMRGHDEALLCNRQDFLVSASVANLFLVSNQRILTPSCACGARPGIVRDWVLHHFEVAEADLPRSLVSTATGAFLTSSWLGVMPIAAIDDRRLASMDTARRVRAAWLQALDTLCR